MVKTLKKLVFFYRERHIFLFFNIATAFLFLTIAWIFFQIDLAGSLMPLQYNIFFGVNRIGSPAQIFTYPLSALLIAAVNYVAAYILFTRDRYLSYSLAVSAAVASFLVFLHIGALTLNIL